MENNVDKKSETKKQNNNIKDTKTKNIKETKEEKERKEVKEVKETKKENAKKEIKKETNKEQNKEINKTTNNDKKSEVKKEESKLKDKKENKKEEKEEKEQKEKKVSKENKEKENKENKKETKTKKNKKDKKEEKSIKPVLKEKMQLAEELDFDKEKLKKIEEELQEVKQTVKEEKIIKNKSRNKRLLANLLLAIAFVTYFHLLRLGLTKIEKTEYLNDLKVFTISLTAFSIILFELGFKKDREFIFLYGVEVLAVAFITLYVYDMVKFAAAGTRKFLFILLIATAVYYIVKDIIILISFKIKEKKKVS